MESENCSCNACMHIKNKKQKLKKEAKNLKKSVIKIEAKRKAITTATHLFCRSCEFSSTLITGLAKKPEYYIKNDDRGARKLYGKMVKSKVLVMSALVKMYQF